jgi:hypothetical protein
MDTEIQISGADQRNQVTTARDTEMKVSDCPINDSKASAKRGEI